MLANHVEVEARLDDWRRAAIAFNTIGQAVATPEFVQVIELGKSAAPRIIERLRDEGWLWDLALCAIFEDSVSADGRSAQADAWLARLQAA